MSTAAVNGRLHNQFCDRIWSDLSNQKYGQPLGWDDLHDNIPEQGYVQLSTQLRDLLKELVCINQLLCVHIRGDLPASLLADRGLDKSGEKK
jgi:hypothetical protein